MRNTVLVRRALGCVALRRQTAELLGFSFGAMASGHETGDPIENARPSYWHRTRAEVGSNSRYRGITLPPGTFIDILSLEMREREVPDGWMSIAEVARQYGQTKNAIKKRVLVHRTPENIIMRGKTHYLSPCLIAAVSRGIERGHRVTPATLARSRPGPDWLTAREIEEQYGIPTAWVYACARLNLGEKKKVDNQLFHSSAAAEKYRGEYDRSKSNTRLRQ
jgi:hypothetical protein